MQKSTEYIQNALDGLYSTLEIKSLTRLIFESVCQYSTVDLILHKNNILSATEYKKIESIVKRLQNFEPIQYILGKTEFYGLSFLTAPGALIPRPETEELVELVIRENPGVARILDIGTGSGCIAIVLSQQLPATTVEAWDISPQALLIARKNNETLHSSVYFKEVDILKSDLQLEASSFDVVVSNPPYVCDSEGEEMCAHVLQYEPHLALFVPDNDPLLFYREIGKAALSLLSPTGKLYFEINARFGKETRELLLSQGYRQVVVIKDISGKERIISAYL